MVKVYQARVWDEAKGKYVFTPGWWTEERIKKMPKGQIIPGTEKEVEPSQLDKDEHFAPKAAEW